MRGMLRILTFSGSSGPTRSTRSWPQIAAHAAEAAGGEVTLIDFARLSHADLLVAVCQALNN